LRTRRGLNRLTYRPGSGSQVGREPGYRTDLESHRAAENDKLGKSTRFDTRDFEALIARGSPGSSASRSSASRVPERYGAAAGQG